MKDKFLDKIASFDKILGFTALSIALTSAFFSVYGIATLFSGAFVLTAIMASTLEIGKLVTVTFLYRYWKQTQTFLKSYLIIAAFTLMIITSLGIFGYLSSAYQKSAAEFKVAQEKIALVSSQTNYLNDNILQAQVRIKTLNDARYVQESRLNSALTNAFLTRNSVSLTQLQSQTINLIKSTDDNIKSEQLKIDTANDSIQKIEEQVSTMKFAAAGTKDIQTFQFVANQFNTSLDNVAKWFIFIIIFVFDPLAVSLVLAYNIVINKKETTPVISLQKTISDNIISNIATDLPITSSININSPVVTPATPSTVPNKSIGQEHSLMFKL